jgi:serine/threonine-protein kinase
VKESLSRATFGTVTEMAPLWMPDSRRILFKSGPAVLRKAIDGTGPTETVVKDAQGGYPTSMSRDEKWLISRTGGGTADMLLKTPMDGSGISQPLWAKSKYFQRDGEISPDGHWIAYDSTESGRSEVYVRPFPDVETGLWKISAEGGFTPMWARSGRELFFVLPSGKHPLMSVAVQPGSASFTFDKPRRLFDLSPYSFAAWHRAFDVSSDGQRFLLVKPVGFDPIAHPSIFVAAHWFEELKPRGPAGR